MHQEEAVLGSVTDWGDRWEIVMCWAGPKAQSPPKPGPFEPGPARPTAGPEVGFGRASDMRKPKAWA